ncbi:exonuclease component of the exosome [Dunaliella salina]|uniref:Ribosomal RNA-processing protein 40 n=1 Tax=Dunaliella salina TaxID=3046 RepID=A0ABQ7GTS7_DUNSA|nr:exonuclease component of the exosome [Dunaliella salina]|eukprot:KAF5838002.1 exonuclease component of the exosome [Dunaliella salina]
MANVEKKVCLPGDLVQKLPEEGVLRLGPGLETREQHVAAVKSGVAHQNKSGSLLWLEGRQKRYIPAEGDVVVGTIVDRYGETFTVDINGPLLALLPQLAFEGATRRNRPNLKSGDLVYARVAAASRDLEPQLSCVDNLGRATVMGPLKDGILVQVTSSQARALLASPPAPVLQALGASLQYEVAVGQNGRVWVCSASPRTTVLVANAISASEFLSPLQIQTLVGRLVAQIQ